MEDCLIPISECVRDSPQFRSSLKDVENEFDELEGKLNKLLKSCEVMFEVGKQFITQQTQFVASLVEVSTHFSKYHHDNMDVLNSINTAIQFIQELIQLQNETLDASFKILMKGSIYNFMNKDMSQVKDTRGYFNKVSADLDTALVKNAQISKTKTHEIQDVSNMLIATQRCFQYTTLDYTCQLSVLKAKEKHVLLQSLSQHLDNYFKEFHRKGDYICKSKYESFSKSLCGHVEALKMRSESVETELERSRHSVMDELSVSNNVSSSSSTSTMSVSSNLDIFTYRDIQNHGPTHIKGYLFKRGQKAFKTWNRRWFYLKDGLKLCYMKRVSSGSGGGGGELNENVVMEEDIRLCLVRPWFSDSDRRCCFEIVSPTKSHVLQADSPQIANIWITNLQQCISQAHHRESSSPCSISFPHDIANRQIGTFPNLNLSTNQQRKLSSRSSTYKLILSKPGNEKCADCDSENPEWASLNLGITLCISCSGVHRSLGVQVSKVRSLTLDHIWINQPHTCKIFIQVGNVMSNEIFQPSSSFHQWKSLKASEDSSSEQRFEWIKCKYVEKRFIPPKLRFLFKNSGHKISDEIRERIGKHGWSVDRYRYENHNQVEITTNTLQNESESENERKATTAAFNIFDEIFPIEVRNSLIISTSCDDEEQLEINSQPEDQILDTRSDYSSLENSKFSDENDEGETDIVFMELNADNLLCLASKNHNLPLMALAFAFNANPNSSLQHHTHSSQESSSKSALEWSVLSGSTMACQYLMLNSADVNLKSHFPLHLSVLDRNVSQVCLLLKYRADYTCIDERGETPLHIAVKNADADIVTLLRLASLNQKSSDGGQINDRDDDNEEDTTFQDVIQEFSTKLFNKK